MDENENIKRLKDHFGLVAGVDFSWASRANSRKAMARTCADPDVMLIEGDVLRCPLSGKPIMSHPPQRISDLDFATWIDMAMAANKVVKIDLKDPQDLVSEIVDVCVQKMKEGQIKLPVILNLAGVVQGPGGSSPCLDTVVDLINQVRRLEPNVILSIDWTTGGWKFKPLKYSKEMMDEMIDFVKNHVGNMSYTLCFAARDVKDSMEHIEYLMKELPEAYLTVWGHTSSSNVPPGELQWIREHLDPRRVTYDVNENMKEGLAGIFDDVGTIVKIAGTFLKETLRHPSLIFKRTKTH